MFYVILRCCVCVVNKFTPKLDFFRLYPTSVPLWHCPRICLTSQRSAWGWRRPNPRRSLASLHRGTPQTLAGRSKIGSKIFQTASGMCFDVQLCECYNIFKGRKVTVANDEASGVNKISDSVVQRLKGKIFGDLQKRQPQSAPAAGPEKVTPPPPPGQEAAPPPPPAPEHPVHWGAQHLRPPCKGGDEEEKRTQDHYWRDRLKKQEVSLSNRIDFCCVIAESCITQTRES